MSKSLQAKNPTLVVGTRSGVSVLVMSLLLLLIIASRVYRLDVDVLDVQTDEAWSVWQTYGTLTDVIRWTPYDWTPLYYVGLGAWRGVVGDHPVMLRWLSVMLFAIGCSALYRVGRRLYGDGLIAMLAYAAFAYMVFLSTEMRGYAFLLALYPLAIWLTLRYFHRPTIRRALPLGILLAAMFYTSLTSAAAIAMLVLFSVFLYGISVWRWIVPGLIAMVIAAPEIINKASIAVARAQATTMIQLPSFGDALINMYRVHTGYPFLIWLALVIISAMLVLLPSPLGEGSGVRLFSRNGASSFLSSPFGEGLGVRLSLLIWLLMPIPLYLTNSVLGFFNQRYAWWVMVGVALFIGAGLIRLPRVVRLGVAAMLIVFAFLPIPLRNYQLGDPPLASAFDWLTDNLRPGDVLLIDPACGCQVPERFAYLSRVYFPDGLQIVTEPANHQRVWYLTGAVGATESVAEQVNRGRVPGVFFGPPEALFRVYEAPPDSAGDLYANGMRFHGAEIVGTNGLPIYHEGESFNLRVWWTADQALPLDYSVGIFLLDSTGNVVLQSDSAPQTTPPETSQWQPETIYVEDRTFTLPFPMPRGTYRVMLALYWYGDPVRFTTPNTDANGLRPLTEIHIASW